eukprot:gene15274-21356_t
MSAGRKGQPLLVPGEEDLNKTTAVDDPKLKAGIERYLEKQASSSKQRVSLQGGVAVEEEEHTGITDDEEEEEEEPDYDVVSRQSLKASSAAMLECMSEAKKFKEMELQAKQKQKPAS